MKQKGKCEPQVLPVGTAGIWRSRRKQAGSSHANKLKALEQELLGQTTHFRSKEAVWYTHATEHCTAMQGKKLWTHNHIGDPTTLSWVEEARLKGCIV